MFWYYMVYETFRVSFSVIWPISSDYTFSFLKTTMSNFVIICWLQVLIFILFYFMLFLSLSSHLSWIWLINLFQRVPYPLPTGCHISVTSLTRNLTILFFCFYFRQKLFTYLALQIITEQYEFNPLRLKPTLRGEGAYLTKRFQTSASTRRAHQSDAATFD